MDLPFHLLNVFSIEGERFSGNPLCVFPEAAGLSDDEMLAWARQFNLSESTFVTSLVDGARPGDAAVRIFTPGHEMPFAGHPTWAPRRSSRCWAGASTPCTSGCPPGASPSPASTVGWRLAARAATVREVTSSGAELAEALGLDRRLVVRSDASWVDAGVEQLLVRLDSVEAVRACDPDAHLMAST